ncbi:MAG: MerR family transcriptional regulator [Herpetosiphonaceae bacterium]|nr:MerR family transcriptional regulator [Herpetosiphonaceae bacterium]
MAKGQFLSAREAAAELGITLPTLYAYVSRGLIHSHTLDIKQRTRHYAREDVEQLKARQEARRSPTKLVETALQWGTPVMDSAITLIEDGRLYYRGCDAVELAQQHSVEYVASLLWTGDGDTAQALFRLPVPPLTPQVQAVQAQLRGMLPVERLMALLPVMGSQDLLAYDLRPQAVVQTGARLLPQLAMIVSDGPFVDDVATTLQHRWCGDDPYARELLKMALIVCTDHELNVSAFTARCVASAGATPYGAVIGGLAALQGIKHGGYTERVAAFLRELHTVSEVRPAVVERIKRGEEIPGFGQRLYPAGDPRARLLFQWLHEHYAAAPALQIATAVIAEAEALQHEPPTIDFALATLAAVLRLPVGAGIALFAVGRSIGWIGHAIEQYQTQQLIRPRARYVGEAPRQQLE